VHVHVVLHVVHHPILVILQIYPDSRNLAEIFVKSDKSDEFDVHRHAVQAPCIGRLTANLSDEIRLGIPNLTLFLQSTLKILVNPGDAKTHMFCCLFYTI
jgi:hypothetical protein